MSQIEEQEKRIERILGNKGEECFEVNLANFNKYIKYLKKEVLLPCELTGRIDFRWEEYYVWGPGDPEEYEELKKTRASYTDKFQLISLDFILHAKNSAFSFVTKVCLNK